MTTWVYVDESKRSGYILAAVSVADPAAGRRVVRGLVLPGQRRLHMHNEQTRRRGVIVSAVVAMPVQATVYEAARTYSTDLAARAACLAALLEDLGAADGITQLVIEQDDSLVQSDRHELYRLARTAGITGVLEYRHQRTYEEPLLALPDIVAWCWARSRQWRHRLDPILTAVRRV